METEAGGAFHISPGSPPFLCSAFPCLEGSHGWGVTRSFTPSSLYKGGPQMWASRPFSSSEHTHPFPGRAGDSPGLPSHHRAFTNKEAELSSLCGLPCPSSMVRDSSCNRKRKKRHESLLSSLASTHTEKPRSCENTKRRRLSAGHGESPYQK